MTRQAPYRPASTMVTLLTLLLLADGALSGVAVWFDWLEAQLLQSFINGVEVPQEELDASDVRQGLMGLAQFGLYVCCVIDFCIWVFRANANARALGAKN